MCPLCLLLCAQISKIPPVITSACTFPWKFTTDARLLQQHQAALSCRSLSRCPQLLGRFVFCTGSLFGTMQEAPQCPPCSNPTHARCRSVDLAYNHARTLEGTSCGSQLPTSFRRKGARIRNKTAHVPEDSSEQRINHQCRSNLRIQVSQINLISQRWRHPLHATQSNIGQPICQLECHKASCQQTHFFGSRQMFQCLDDSGVPLLSSDPPSQLQFCAGV